MAGSIVTTQSVVGQMVPALLGSMSRGIRSVIETSIVWTSDAAGAVSGNTVTMPSGSIVIVEFIPGAGGLAPTDLYDVTFTDAEGVNMFDDGTGTSVGANLSATVASHKTPFVSGAAAGATYVRAWLHGGAYTPVVAAAGNAKSGTINIFQCLDVL